MPAFWARWSVPKSEPVRGSCPGLPGSHLGSRFTIMDGHGTAHGDLTGCSRVLAGLGEPCRAPCGKEPGGGRGTPPPPGCCSLEASPGWLARPCRLGPSFLLFAFLPCWLRQAWRLCSQPPGTSPPSSFCPQPIWGGAGPCRLGRRTPRCQGRSAGAVAWHLGLCSP